MYDPMIFRVGIYIYTTGVFFCVRGWVFRVGMHPWEFRVIPLVSRSSVSMGLYVFPILFIFFALLFSPPINRRSLDPG